MYEAFYGLTEKPFSLTPDPRFLYLSEKHKEAFAHLTYGIKNRSGFVMISGEIGTGKTTICRSLLNQFDSDTELAFIFNPFLSSIELLGKINEDFGIPSKAQSVKGLIDELNAFLLERASEGKNCVLVIDEAQNLEPTVLEQIRLLSNLETETQKLLQIVLIGQPELAEKLEMPELRQLNQRITARYHLKELNYPETLQYVAFRLRVAGGRKRVRFTRAAIRAVYAFSKGTPRVINTVCDRALLIGYTKELRSITPRLVRMAAKEIRGEKIRKKKKSGLSSLIPTRALLTTAVVALLAVILLTPGPVAMIHDTVQSWRGAWEAIMADEAPPSPRNQARATVVEPQKTAALPGKNPRNHGGADDAAPKQPPPKEVAALVAPPDSKKGVEEAEKMTAATPNQVNARLDELLESLDARAACDEAVSALLRTWNVAVLSDLPGEITFRSIAGFAEANGLAHVFLTQTFEQLLTVNMPVLIQLDAGDRNLWAALLAAEPGRVRIAVKRGVDTLVSQEDLEERHTGKAVYLWLDPDPHARPLRGWASGQNVTAFQDALRSLRLFPHEPSGLYDEETIAAVMRIQRAAGIAVDGVAGPHTRMVLNSWLEAAFTPSLDPEAFAQRIRGRVLEYSGDAPAKPRKVASRPAPVAPPVPPIDPAPLAPVAPVVAETPVAAPDLEAAGVKTEELPAPGSYEPILAPPAPETEKSVTAPSTGSYPIVPRESGNPKDTAS